MKIVLICLTIIGLSLFGVVGYHVWQLKRQEANSAVVSPPVDTFNPQDTQDGLRVGDSSYSSPNPILVTIPALSTESSQSTRQITIRLGGGYASKPTAFDMRFQYNPQAIEVTEISAGNIWAEANVLKSTIDPGAGEIRFAAGQNFNTSQTANNDLMYITYRSLQNTDSALSLIESPSIFAFTGGQSQPVTINNLQVTTN